MQDRGKNMFGRWWARTIILLLSLFLFILGFYIIAVRVGNNGIGFVIIFIGFVLFRVYTLAVKKASSNNRQKTPSEHTSKGR